MGYTTRQMREYMARRRGTTSYKSVAEDAPVLVAFAAGEISTVRAAQLLGCNKAELRRRFNAMVDEAKLRDAASGHRACPASVVVVDDTGEVEP